MTLKGLIQDAERIFQVPVLADMKLMPGFIPQFKTLDAKPGAGILSHRFLNEICTSRFLCTFDLSDVFGT